MSTRTGRRALTLALIVLAACIPPDANLTGPEVDGPELTVPPVLAYEGSEPSAGLPIHWLSVVNWPAYDDRLFEPAPHLPPCGRNARASRTWLEIYDARDGRIYGFCALTRAEDLAHLGFSWPAGTSAPAEVYITLVDRETGVRVSSDLVALR